MKIEIDLNDILGDDSGTETLKDSIKRQVIERLTKDVEAGIAKKIDNAVANTISVELSAAVKDRMPSLIDELMEAEYTPVDRWGDFQRDKTTTFRKELIKSIHGEMVYKKSQYDNDSDKNTFSRAVDTVIKDNVDAFKTSFNKLVNETFTREILEYSMGELRKKFGVKG